MTKPAVNLIWRFYMDNNHRWKWQQLTVHREVIAESHTAYRDYEECLADARGKGYDFQPSQAKLVPGQPR